MNGYEGRAFAVLAFMDERRGHCRCNPRRKSRFASTCRGCGIRVDVRCYHAQAHESHKPNGRIATVIHDGVNVFKRDA